MSVFSNCTFLDNSIELLRCKALNCNPPYRSHRRLLLLAHLKIRLALVLDLTLMAVLVREGTKTTAPKFTVSCCIVATVETASASVKICLTHSVITVSESPYIYVACNKFHDTAVTQVAYDY